MSSKVATAVLMNFSNFCDLKATKNAFLQFLVAIYIWSKIYLKRNGKMEIKSILSKYPFSSNPFSPFSPLIAVIEPNEIF